MFIKNFDHLLELAKQRGKRKVAVAAADDLEILSLVNEAEKIQLADFILIGDRDKIEKIISESKLTVNAEVIHEPEHAKAADIAVDYVVGGKAEILMKGMLHSGTFLRAVLNKEKGLNTGKRITQISVIEKEDENGGLMLITDCAITVDPDLMGKKEVLENAVGLAKKFGYERPNVAVLASLETINPSMQDTLDAAILSKMSERGQIKDCIVDGPFAFDNAISKEAAAHKGITSSVAGNADIILVPNLTVGNTLTKAITYVAKKRVVAAVAGVSVPIVFTSRTESMDGKLLSIALANCIS